MAWLALRWAKGTCAASPHQGQGPFGKRPTNRPLSVGHCAVQHLCLQSTMPSRHSALWCCFGASPSPHTGGNHCLHATVRTDGPQLMCGKQQCGTQGHGGWFTKRSLPRIYRRNISWKGYLEKLKREGNTVFATGGKCGTLTEPNPSVTATSPVNWGNVRACSAFFLSQIGCAKTLVLMHNLS